MFIRYRAIAVIAWLCFFSLALSEENESRYEIGSRPSVAINKGDAPFALESDKAKAARLLKAGKAQEAYDLYMRLLRENPSDEAAAIGVAQSASRIGRWNQVVLALEMLLERRPREIALYDQLAHAYLALNDKASAERMQELKRDLARGVDIGEFPMDALRKRYGLLQIHGKVRLGALYDSNANQGTDDADMQLGGLRLEIPDSEAISTYGGYASVNADLTRKLERDSVYHAAGDAHVYIRRNANSDLSDIHSRQSQWGRAAAGLRRLTSESLLDMRLKAEVFDYDRYQHVSSYGLETTFLWVVTPYAQTISRGGLERRAYSRNDDRDGIYYSAGQYARFFQPNYEFTLGAQYRGSSPKERDYVYDGWDATARFRFDLPYDFELSPSVTWTKDRYKGPATALETEKREDERLRFGADLTYRINESWTIETGYQHTANKSTSELYEYKQRYINLEVARSF
ncbi:MAG: surface lipoprotein assembly modifier [Helicobacteraceae bacterium]|nr:surface lipoprotein assembly modifier [Helicobacteraceae bacterium]